eukprot:TRINITY_DN15823_c0_g1_i1.p1 TRINITY_DN15823_c0_g1~~TRINITY_DN15823_c0_g1_i1.p1  ORF type:complete len:199 (-),score=61.13 TRINITY_DN15823_c0_g1_i1:41-637(-)
MLTSSTTVAKKITTCCCVAMVVVVTMMTVAEARPTCESCLATGYPYFCKASITSHICFTKAGDAQCDHLSCVCCKAELLGGCSVCEETDEDDGEEVLEQTDNWQSHEMRKKMEDDLKTFHSERDRDLALEAERKKKQKQVDDDAAAAKKKEEETAAATPTTTTTTTCLLYTSDAADEEDSVDLGGRRIIKKTKTHTFR